jgi:hypothetical protein
VRIHKREFLKEFWIKLDKFFRMNGQRVKKDWFGGNYRWRAKLGREWQNARLLSFQSEM